MTVRLSHVALRILGGKGIVARTISSSLHLCSSMGLPVGKHIGPFKLVPVNDELVWDRKTIVVEPCIHRITDTIGKNLTSLLQTCAKMAMSSLTPPCFLSITSSSQRLGKTAHLTPKSAKIHSATNLDDNIGSLETCKPPCNRVSSPPNGVASVIQPSHSTTALGPSKATLGRHLACRLIQIAVDDVFSVPGDFNLTLLDHLLAEPGLNLISCYNELNAGYAADG